MRRLMMLTSLLPLLLLGPSYAYTDYGRVSPAEFRAVDLGTRKWEVHRTWGTVGELRRTWTDENGREWRKKRYRTTQLRYTHVNAYYRKTLVTRYWRLQKKEWCIILDAARGDIVFGVYLCKPRPWPW